MNHRRNNLSEQLKRVLANVDNNIREQHQRGLNIGRRGRGDRQRLLEQRIIKPVAQVFEDALEDDDEEGLTTP